jgi:hypothetical protein
VTSTVRRRVVRPELTPAATGIVVCVCLYEPVAIASKRIDWLPDLLTISTLCKRYPLFKAALLAVLTLHVDLLIIEAVEEAASA